MSDSKVTLKFAEIGRQLARDWCRIGNTDHHGLIKSLDEPGRQTCLLAAAVESLAAVAVALHDLRHEVRQLKAAVEAAATADRRRRAAEAHAFADGYLAILTARARLPATTPLANLDLAGLSVRARNALCRTEATTVGELTREALLRAPNCGKTTTDEVAAWFHAQAGRDLPDR